MCTAITYKTKDFYFGRTLDYEFSYGEKITIVPRNYNFNFKYQGNNSNHYAIIGNYFYLCNITKLLLNFYYFYKNLKLFAFLCLTLLIYVL